MSRTTKPRIVPNVRYLSDGCCPNQRSLVNLLTIGVHASLPLWPWCEMLFKCVCRHIFVKYSCALVTLGTCPSSTSWGVDVKSQNFTSRPTVECSNKGICDRSTGKCSCAPGFTGYACNMQKCNSRCNGRGTCVSMETIAYTDEESPLFEQFFYGDNDASWDAHMIHGCICDSSESWEVGLSAGQYQVSEYFGADCGLKRCPSGNDPMTEEDETDCEGVNGAAAGNLCYVPCSNRGQCNEKTGRCSCFDGFAGENCEFLY